MKLSLVQIRWWLLLAFAALAAVDLAAVLLLLSPAANGVERRMDDYGRLRAEVHQLESSNRLQLYDESRLSAANRQVSEFCAQHLPQHYSELSAELHTRAAANHVRLDAVTYSTGKGDKKESNNAELAARQARTGLQPISLELKVDGDYRSDVQFLNALERSPLLFAVRAVAIGSSSGKDKGMAGSVEFVLHAESYLRSERP
jgi:hypothetical protein